MKSILLLAFLLLTIPHPIQSSIVVEPRFELVDTSIERFSEFTSKYRITFTIEAPIENDIFVDLSESSLNDPFYGNPGDGWRWDLNDSPESPPRPGTLITRKLELLTPPDPGNTAAHWKIPAGSTLMGRFVLSLGLTPFEPNPPERWISLGLTDANWDVDPTAPARYFTNLGDNFQTEYAQFGQPQMPEPSTSLLTLVGICSVVSRRKRQANHIQ